MINNKRISLLLQIHKVLQHHVIYGNQIVFERDYNMERFISNHQFNKITRLMKAYQSTLKFSADEAVIAAAKAITNEEILGLFSDKSDEV